MGWRTAGLDNSGVSCYTASLRTTSYWGDSVRTMKTFEIWDLETANKMGDFHTLEEARIVANDIYGVRPKDEEARAVIVVYEDEYSEPESVDFV